MLCNDRRLGPDGRADYPARNLGVTGTRLLRRRRDRLESALGRGTRREYRRDRRRLGRLSPDLADHARDTCGPMLRARGDVMDRGDERLESVAGRRARKDDLGLSTSGPAGAPAPPLPSIPPAGIHCGGLSTHQVADDGEWVMGLRRHASPPHHPCDALTTKLVALTTHTAPTQRSTPLT